MPRLAFLGSKRSGFNALLRLIGAVPRGTVSVILCPDDRSDERSVLSEFQALAELHDIPLNIGTRRSEIPQLLKSAAVDLAIVHGWYQLIAVEEMPDIQFLGFHYSPLPEFRGNAPLVWQIISGRSEIGVSFFQLTAGMDDGPLVDQQTVALGDDETIDDALAKIDLLVEGMVDNFSAALVEDRLTLRPQPEREPSYCGIRTAEDGRIDWCWNARKIHDFIRAQSAPYPGAFSFLADGSKLTIWSSRVEPDNYMGVPGSVVAIRDDHVVVAAGQGAVRLFSIQRGEDKALPAPLVLKSLRTRLN